jgi:ESF2/ABP1 family protein
MDSDAAPVEAPVAAEIDEKTKQKIAKFQESEDRKGVVYLSRVPPYMRVEKLRHLMSQFGLIGRIYLTPEDPGM